MIFDEMKTYELTCEKYRKKSEENPEIPGDAHNFIKPSVEADKKIFQKMIFKGVKTHKLKEAKTRHQILVDMNGKRRI